MQTLITVVHIVACALLILVVLVQSGKGAEISASLGGSSQTVFGSSGGANFFTRLTTALAAIFMICSLVLTVMANRSRRSLFEGAAPVAPVTLPADQKGLPIDPTAPQAPAAPAETKPAQ